MMKLQRINLFDLGLLSKQVSLAFGTYNYAWITLGGWKGDRHFPRQRETQSDAKIVLHVLKNLRNTIEVFTGI